MDLYNKITSKICSTGAPLDYYVGNQSIKLMFLLMAQVQFIYMRVLI